MSEPFEHTGVVTSSAPAARVWALWSDPATWSDWDPSVQAVALEAPFAEGVAGTMVLGGGFEVPVVIDVVEDGRRYLDRLTMGELVIRIDHVVEATDAGCEVTVSTTIEGPGAGDIGPIVTAEAPLALTRLVELAES